MDSVDRKIVAKLQRNCRITNAELARQIGLAPSSMFERVRRLEQRGVLRGYQALIDPKATGHEIHAFVSVSLAIHKTAVIRRFKKSVKDIPEVIAVHQVTGRSDFLLQVVADDLKHLGRLIEEDIATAPGTRRTRATP